MDVLRNGAMSGTDVTRQFEKDFRQWLGVDYALGFVGGMSLMSGKAWAIGEAGMLVTNDREIYERSVAFGHYERNNSEIQTEDLKHY